MPAALRPIIKKRRPVAHAAHHGGAWKVAFADFMTAMMAFFLVMWIMGLSESTRHAIAGYFRQPGIFFYTSGKAMPTQVAVVAEEHAGDGSGATGKNIESVIQHACEAAVGPSAAETGKIEALKEDLEKKLDELAESKPELKKLIGSVDMKVTSEGLRIELSETKDIAFFEVGGAQPNKPARDVLSILAPRLAEMGNDVVIEGHTDTRPYYGATYTNWELSADRANAARKLLVDAGLAPTQIMSVSGYANMRLRRPDEPYDISNRRVSVVVKYKEQPKPELDTVTADKLEQPKAPPPPPAPPTKTHGEVKHDE